MPLVGVRAKVESSDKWKEEFKTHGELFKSQGVIKFNLLNNFSIIYLL